MLKALFTAATGLKSQQLYVDTIANNLANINTNGFKSSQLDFEDLLYDQLRAAGAEESQGFMIPAGLEVGSGVRAISTRKDFRPGSLEQTNNPLDLAIRGEHGFFKITMPDGTSTYTRDGSFRLNEQRQLVNANGYPLDPQITIPDNWTSITVGSDGTVSVITADSPTAATSAGQILVSVFPNPAGLNSLGQNLFEETPAAGAPTDTTPGESGAGDIAQGFLEGSNVDMVTELVKLIVAQRAYEVNSKAIQSSDQMLAAANNLVR